MRLERYRFQINAADELRQAVGRAIRHYVADNDSEYNYVVSLQAPTGSGKTIIMASLIEDVYCGSTIIKPDSSEPSKIIEAQPNAIFVWLSDSPALNKQSMDKIDLKADKIRLDQCVTIQEDSFDMEMLEDGHIYFLNTQKLSVMGKLGIRSDTRQYTIWETLENTAREKADRLYFIIDEAHRGMMESKSASKANSIMQKFIKGNPEQGMRPMPVIIGMSATAARFERLVEKCSKANLYTVKVPAEQVRYSGLLKDKIVVTYPDDESKFNETAVLQAATKEWVKKSEHWRQFCREQHSRNVDHVFVVQVEKGNGKEVSNTDLNHVIKTIEDTLGEGFHEHEVVHTFGSVGYLVINGLTVHHIEPERIADDHRIKVVLFKEALSTGWDCPRAETMMSYCTAEDATYIAQLLGRMVRTPLGARVTVDESLNEVRMYLPYFNAKKVEEIINELKSNEGEDIPADVEGEEFGKSSYRPYSVHPKKKEYSNPNQEKFDFGIDSPASSGDNFSVAEKSESQTATGSGLSRDSMDNQPSAGTPVHDVPNTQPAHSAGNDNEDKSAFDGNEEMEDALPKTPVSESEQIPLMPQLDRDEVLEFINSKGFLSFNVKDTRVNDYLVSLMDLSSLLTTSGIYQDANDEISADITAMIHEYAEGLRAGGQYTKLKNEIQQMKLSVQIYDIFGDEIKQGVGAELFITDTIIDKEASKADMALGKHNYVGAYINRYINEAGEDARDCQIDCILFAANKECLEKLNSYAKKKFHTFNDQYRIYTVNESEDIKRRYNKIVAAGDKVSKTNLALPASLEIQPHPQGATYYKHLYVDEDTGVAKIKLNNWEEPTIREENDRPDFVCWVRNQSRAQWALKLPYKMNNKTFPMYPDFLIIRSDPKLKYVMDILEPHGPQYVDGLYKAKGMAEYARQEGRVGRIQMIREKKDISTGKNRLLRLDFTKGEVQDEIEQAMSSEEFDHIFEKYGVYEA